MDVQTNSNELETEGRRYAAPHVQKRNFKGFSDFEQKRTEKVKCEIQQNKSIYERNRHTMRITERARN